MTSPAEKLAAYDAVRARMKTGDAVQWRGNNLVGSLIRIRSDYFNHTSMVLCMDEFASVRDRRFMVEALAGPGVTLTALSRRLADFDNAPGHKVTGEVWWYPLLPEFDRFRAAMGDWAMSHVGVTDYDLKNALRHAIGRPQADDSELYCSECYFLAAVHAGIVSGTTVPTPGDIPLLGIFGAPVQLL